VEFTGRAHRVLANHGVGMNSISLGCILFSARRVRSSSHRNVQTAAVSTRMTSLAEVRFLDRARTIQGAYPCLRRQWGCDDWRPARAVRGLPGDTRPWKPQWGDARAARAIWRACRWWWFARALQAHDHPHEGGRERRAVWRVPSSASNSSRRSDHLLIGASCSITSEPMLSRGCSPAVRRRPPR